MFGAPAVAPAAVVLPDADYVAKLAAAIVEVGAAQGRILEEVDAASRTPALVQDPQWQERTYLAARMLAAAGNMLRIQPLPESMRIVDGVLTQAQEEAQLASQAHIGSVSAGSLPAMVA